LNCKFQFSADTLKDQVQKRFGDSEGLPS